MSALLGLLATEEQRGSAPSAGPWAAALEALAERDPRPARQTQRGHGTLATRGRDLSGTDRKHQPVLAFDGWVPRASEGAVTATLPTPPETSLAQGANTEWDPFLRRLEGSFALIALDPPGESMTLARDHFGTRPLFYARTEGGWIGSSEIRGILPFLSVRRLDPSGLRESLHYRWLAGRRTLIDGVVQVLPGERVTLRRDGTVDSVRYWTMEFQPAAHEGIRPWIDRTEEALSSFLARAFEADEKVGILLSGGVDSSLVTALAAPHIARLEAFTVRLSEGDDPELHRARRFAAHLGLSHRIVELDDDFVGASYPRYVRRLEQPPRSFSGIAYDRLLRAVGEAGCDAVLYCEAADALFGPDSLRFHRNYGRKRQFVERLPRVVRSALAVPLPRRGRWGRARRLLGESLETEMRRKGWLQPPRRILRAFGEGYLDPEPNPVVPRLLPDRSSWMEVGQMLGLTTNIPEHFLMVDRLAQPCRVEVVNPFLSPEVVDVASRLPRELKLDGDRAKPVLKELACRHFPRAWIHAPKLGFPVPRLTWMRGPLADRLARLKEGRGWTGTVVPADVLASLELPRDHEIVWTLMALDELHEGGLEWSPAEDRRRGGAGAAISSTR